MFTKSKSQDQGYAHTVTLMLGTTHVAPRPQDVLTRLKAISHVMLFRVEWEPVNISFSQIICNTDSPDHVS